MTKIRSSSELPDDEGRVFVTYMPDAPFHVMGRRADSGKLFVGAIVPKEKITTENLRNAPVRVEVVAGREAEDHCRGAQRGQGLRRDAGLRV
jgi:hypothetical protein